MSSHPPPLHQGCCKQGIKQQHSTYDTLQAEITVNAEIPLLHNDKENPCVILLV